VAACKGLQTLQTLKTRVKLKALKGKITVKLAVCLTQHHAMRTSVGVKA
jgi:hypothetical protein